MTDATDVLIVLARWPEPGQAKTRLIPALGPEGAAHLHRAMVDRTLRTARQFTARWPCRIEVRLDSAEPEAARGWLGTDVALVPQGDGTLGVRLSRAVDEAFRTGARAVGVIGTDTPGITAATLERAFRAVALNDVVVGPATDGGYYLIALGRPAPLLFEDIPWGGSGVFEATLVRIAVLGLSVARLEVLPDVDRPVDLPVWAQARRPSREWPASSRISVVVPALNEATRVASAIAAARAPGVEVVVADGGSVDDTVSVASAAGATVVGAPRGRARQMNAGAACATGDLLVFLHADSRLPPGFDVEVRRVLADGRVSAGAFAFAVDRPFPGSRLVERAVNLRSRRLGLPYGDQALFMRRCVFERVGGYPALPILKDVTMIKRLAREGGLAIVADAVRTSSRRWRALGVMRTTLINQAILLGYALGVSPDRLARLYRAAAVGDSPGSSRRLPRSFRIAWLRRLFRPAD